MMKYAMIGLMAVVLTGCGAVDRVVAKYTGKGSEVCQDGVVYLQFTSGTSVKYDKSGKIVTCN